ncbi:MAG: tryptophan--tRNA ligase [Thermoprotei archaeon]|nr:MAG: tryptophan--tRNA ligase [Thermoprotei archaeon]
MKVTPWEVEGPVDYDRLIEVFGVKPLTEDLIRLTGKYAGEVHLLLRRKVFYAHRDYDVFLKRYGDKEPVALYTGRGPSSKVHLGHLVPWIFTRWLQERLGLELYFQLTDDEKFLYHRDYTLEYTNSMAYENLLDLIALGFDPKKTFVIVDSEDIAYLYNIALRVAKKITASIVKAVFGFTDSTNIGMYFFPSLQIAMCFLPSTIRNEKVLVLIPAAIDQDPYWRVARDIASSLGYPKPAQIHSKFLPGLGPGGKMSSSRPETAIYTTDSPEAVYRKIMNAFTGGQPTAELQRKLGGNPDKCPVFTYYSMLFEPSEEKLSERYRRCKAGEILCGECKRELAERVAKFIEGHQKRRERARDRIEDFLIRTKVSIRK